MKKVIIDGNTACSYAAYLFTEAAGIYPITPSSPMAESMDEWSNNGLTNIFGDKVKVIQMQSEAGASGLVHGLLRSGILTTTFTASQGLLLMIPNMYKIAGEMLPCVMHVAARSLSTHALSILGDHQDIYATRSTGFNMLASSNVSDANYLGVVAHLSAIESSLPFMHFFDGFRTSHELQKIDILEEKDVKDLINYDKLNEFRFKAINPYNPKTYGTSQSDDVYFQATEIRNKYYDKVPDIVNDYMDKINKITNNNYKPFNYYGSKTAKKVIVAMGSVCETIKEVIDDLKEYGLIEVHLYRPFSSKYFLTVLPSTVDKVAVLDRTKEFNNEPLYLDVVNVLKNKNISVVGGRYGLSSKNTTPSQIKAVYDMLDNPIHNFTIGIYDDVTNLSLKETDYKLNNSLEMLIYGYGSDGMVSAAKSLIKLVGKNTSKYVQGYFQYDSKKSGGVTNCHLRFSDDKIKSTYYVEHPSLIVVTKDTYLDDYEILNKINDNGIFVLNTVKSEKEVIDFLPSDVKYIIKNKNIKFYIINAYELASKAGIKNKISTIMEVAILHLSNLLNDDIINQLKEDIKNRFGLKGEEIVKANVFTIDNAIDYLKEVKLDGNYEYKERPKYIDVYLEMRHRKGDELKVSSFEDMPDGTFNAGTSKEEKRCISDFVPKWISSNCIKCNMCSFVCPHGVIRPYQLSDEEYEKAPDYIKKRCIDKYIIGISVKDCTGCGLCIKSCMSKEKSLEFKELITVEEEQAVFDYLSSNITCKEGILNNVKNTQFKEPKLEFSGACAGCGETPYIKLLTQLFGDSMIIANATGCSSIYGASAPSTPYTIPWASSLFEDNAEYGYGFLQADKIMKQKIINIMSKYKEFEEYINNIHDYNITKKYYDSIDFDKYKELLPYKDYIVKRSIWAIGGDGWAYDIGFSGIDHVLASGENIKILVLDTQVYSNTGGQASKATPKGSVALFTSSGKQTNKKDLAKMMMTYPNVYVAQVSLGANPIQLIKAFNEANSYEGPAIIIAYAPCISHGIKGGMVNSIDIEKEAVKCGYFPIFRRNPLTKFSLDCNPDFNLYEEFLLKQTRYTMLDKLNKEADELLKLNKENAIKTYEYYKKLSDET